MLTSVEASNTIGDLLQFPLDDITDGFSVQDITGLDPVKATIVTSSFATKDGDQYEASRREKRTIVLKLGLEADYSTMSARQLRNRLYQYFMPKSEVFLKFYSDDQPTVNIGGRVESFDSPQFTANPEASISVVCVNPDFVDPRGVVVSGSTVASTTEQLVTYSGTVDTGFVLKLNINRNFSQFSVYNRGNDGVSRKMDFYATLLAGDVLELSTVPGQKGVTVVRSGTRVSVLYGLTPYSDWLHLFPGRNYFRVYAEGAAIPYTIEYTDKYGGL